MADLDRTDPAKDEFPRPFGHYVLLHRIATGGMGSVYLARRDMGGIEKHCVVKTLKAHYTEDPEYVARFIDEARVVVQLSHRNICHVFDVGKVGTRHYLAMEYVPGTDVKTLRDRLAMASMPVPDAVGLHLTVEVLDALDYAHRHEDPVTGQRLRLVHRDVSPQNVMINFEGEVKLIDFGLAASELKDEKTQPNIVMGKLAYMAPEHASGQPVDGRSDLFATAIVAYELLSGERFYGERPVQKIWGMAGVGGFLPDGFWKLEEGLQAILGRALKPDPNSRFATCAEMKEALEEYRYARGLRSGAEKLRSIMADHFADEREHSRRLLAALGSDRSPARHEPTEPTVTIAVAPSIPDFTVRSEPAPAMPSRRARPALWGGLAVAAAAVLGVAIASISAPAPPAVAALAVTPPTPPPTPPTPKPEPVATAPTPTPVAVEAPPAPAEAPPPRAPVKRPPRRPQAPGLDATDGQRMTYLRSTCPKLGCVAEVQAFDAAWKASKSKDDIARFKSAIRDCVKKCAK